MLTIYQEMWIQRTTGAFLIQAETFKTVRRDCKVYHYGSSTVDYTSFVPVKTIFSCALRETMHWITNKEKTTAALFSMGCNFNVMSQQAFQYAVKNKISQLKASNMFESAFNPRKAAQQPFFPPTVTQRRFTPEAHYEIKKWIRKHSDGDINSLK